MKIIWVVKEDHLDCEGRYSTHTDIYYFDNKDLANACYLDLKKRQFSFIHKPKEEIINKNWRE